MFGFDTGHQRRSSFVIDAYFGMSDDSTEVAVSSLTGRLCVSVAMLAGTAATAWRRKLLIGARCLFVLRSRHTSSQKLERPFQPPPQAVHSRSLRGGHRDLDPASMLSPLYIAENLSPRLRGKLHTQSTD